MLCMTWNSAHGRCYRLMDFRARRGPSFGMSANREVCISCIALWGSALIVVLKPCFLRDLRRDPVFHHLTATNWCTESALRGLLPLALDD